VTVSLWIDSEKETTIDLGGTLDAYKAFSEMAQLAGDTWTTDYEALSGVLSQCEDQADAEAKWLAEVQEQAAAFLKAFGDKLSDAATEILEALIKGPEAEAA